MDKNETTVSYLQSLSR